MVPGDADTTHVTIDTNGRVWDVSRSDRDPTKAQCLAIIGRDMDSYTIIKLTPSRGGRPP